MGYRNNGYDRRGGYGYDDRRGGYDDRRGGGYGYDRGPRNFRFDIGQKVIHIATGIELSIIGYGREQLECRKPDLTTVWMYEDELRLADEDPNAPKN